MARVRGRRVHAGRHGRVDRPVAKDLIEEYAVIDRDAHLRQLRALSLKQDALLLLVILLQLVLGKTRNEIGIPLQAIRERSRRLWKVVRERRVHGRDLRRPRVIPIRAGLMHWRVSVSGTRDGRLGMGEEVGQGVRLRLRILVYVERVVQTSETLR